MVVQAGCRAVPQWAWAWTASRARYLHKTAAASLGHQHSRRYSSHSVSEPRWRYEADEAVTNMITRVQKGILSNTLSMTLNTAVPVSPKVFEDALMHLYRKVEALRVCFRERDGHLWVADMDTPKMDFQMVEDGHLDYIIKTTARTSYNLAEGPLWRARLVVCPPDEPCMLPQVKGAFPHQYHLVIDTHHAALDGLCNMTMMQIFFTILDSMLDGVQIDDEQIGEFRGPREVRTAEARIRETLEKNPQRLKVLLEERYKIKTKVPLITEAFGKPQEPSPDTYILPPEVLDNKLLQIFNAKCKKHKVTFNSGFTGVLNVALMELVRETGVVRDSYMISTRHPVDTRRYMSDVTSMVWGFHSAPLTQPIATPWNARKNFWKYVVDFDTKFRDRINNMSPLEERVLDDLLQLTNPDHKYQTTYDYMITNLYSPRIKPSGNGKHVQLTNTILYSLLNGRDEKLLSAVNGFRDQVQYQLVYSSVLITRENAAKFFNKVISVFNEIAKLTD